MAKRIVEPFRIKMVEKIRVPSREEREAALKKQDITHSYYQVMLFILIY